jgi:F-type H+-transporting ATPase subunit epsilon
VTILPNHRSYIGALKAGEIMVKTGGQETLLAVSGGFVEFHGNKLAVLADTAERAEEIDVKRAEEAIKRAEELKQQRQTMDDLEYAKVAAAIEKENARLRVARRHHTKSGINLD